MATKPIRWLVVSLLVMGTTVGCGTRVRREAADPAAALDQGSSSPAQAGAWTPSSEVADMGSASSATGAADPVPAAAAASPTNTAVRGPGAASPSQGTRAATPGAAAPGASGSAGVKPSKKPADDGGATVPSPGAGTAVAGAKSKVLVGSVGTLSGPVGSAVAPGMLAVQVWVKTINTSGGVNGHLVELVVADDGGDPARHRSLLQQLVEQKKVVAFVYNAEVLTGRQSIDYLNQVRIPVIGTDTGANWVYDSPMYFPQASSGHALLLGGLASVGQQAVAQGKKKVAIITCQEAQVCADADRLWTGSNAEGVGLSVVYRAKVSLAQPDFTAECLGARNAGAELFMVAVDGNSVGRLANSCGRQNYRPLYGLISLEAADHLPANPYLENSPVGTNGFPWTESSSPATVEFQGAMKRYAPGTTLNATHPVGWLAGKLFERATRDLPEPPTTQAILDGLWSIKNDTLGGLTYPLSFTRDTNPPVVTCWFNMTIRDGRYLATDGLKLQCRP